MKLFELFSRPDQDSDDKRKDPRLDHEINYADDLKYFIDNEDSLLSKFFFPAIDKQKRMNNQENSFKLYIDPVSKSIDIYCRKFKLDDVKDKIFNNEIISDVAKKIAGEQGEHIKKKAYEEK